MAAKPKKSAKPAPEAPPAGWHREETAGSEQDGEWVTPIEGLVVQGRLTKAFLFPSKQKKEPGVAYSIRNGEAVQLLSERASYRDAMRSLRLGTSVRLTFGEKIALEGKQRGQTMWQVDMLSKRDGDGQLVRDVLLAAHRKGEQAPPPPTSNDDVPF